MAIKYRSKYLYTRGAGIGKTHVDAAADQRADETLCAIHTALFLLLANDVAHAGASYGLSHR
jgi:hypothetical protein